MNEYNYEVDMWWVNETSEQHGKLDGGLFLAVPFVINEWFDNEEDYLTRLSELNIEI
jgi:hypothetical protein